MKNFIPYFLVCCVLAACSPKQDTNYVLGELNFDVTATPEAMPFFKKGYLLLHSFEYEDAREVFLEAQRIDPGFVMAYWGEAMSYNHPIWQEQDFEKGRSVLQKLRKIADDRPKNASSSMEEDFIQAIEILYGEGTKTVRDKAYADFMGSLYQKYPDNHEVAAFYALSLLGSVVNGRDENVYQTSAKVSAQILKENPKHPGALHYFIHANDDPEHAKEALLAANEYAIVAPDAAHALHMPTHIYVAMGMWDQVVTSNEQSWEASEKRKQMKDLSNDALGYHSFHWLQYGYLQQGRKEDAEQMLEEMVAYCTAVPSQRARAHEIFLKTTFLAETGNWNSKWADTLTDASDLNISTRSLEYFMEGMKFYSRGDAVSLESVLSKMEKDRKREEAFIGTDGIAMCSSGGASRKNATRLDIDIATIMETQLRAKNELLKNNFAEAEHFMKLAAASEDGINYTYGPPSVVKPSHELYGEFLLVKNRPNEAIVQFDKALERAPKRLQSLKGKLEASKMLKNKELEMRL